MYCPDCGQQQISNETRFCSRCGLPLNLVAEVVANGGTLPQLAQLDKEAKRWFSKKNGMVFGLFWFLIFTVVFTSFLGLLGAPDELMGLLALMGVFGGLLIVLFSAFFLPGKPKPLSLYPHSSVPNPAQFAASQQRPGALPPQQSVPVQNYAPPAGSWRDTNDLSRPSVTEGTTRLLTKEEENRS